MARDSIEKTGLRTQMVGGLRAEHAGERATLTGWVHRRRDVGGLLFVDLRDRSGLVQVSFGPEWTEAESLELAHRIGHEDVVGVEGVVALRPEGARNDEMSTGEIEFRAERVRIFSDARTPEIPVYRAPEDELPAEELRLQHRVLDLRRGELQRNLTLRHRLVLEARNYLDRHGFLEVETPILTKATPEGARDYLVPSRVHKGEFYALPQSPQIYKQILMVAGFDRYFQIARCFRDEDLRADRQPEFTQLDVEVSFMNENEFMNVMEEMVRQLFQEVVGHQLPAPFPRMTYTEAVQRFGTDRPDLRIPLELVDVGDLMEEVEFKVFAGPAKDPKGRVAALRLPQGSRLTRKEIDEYTKFVGIYGARGLAYVKVNDWAKGREAVGCIGRGRQSAVRI